MSFLRQRTERHRRGGESTHDLVGGLDLVHRFGTDKSEQIADHCRIPIVDGGQILVPEVPITGTDRLLKIEDHHGSGDVSILTTPVLVEATRGWLTADVSGM